MPAQYQTVTRLFVGLTAVALAVFLIVRLLVLATSQGPAARRAELGPVVGALHVDRALPEDFAAYTLEAGSGGETLRLADFAGDTTVVLNFWATWCEPCVRELPSLIQLGRQLADTDFALVTVSYDKDWAVLGGFFDRVFNGVPRELVMARDPGADRPDALRLRFGTEKLPETWVIKDGRIVSRFVADRNWTDPLIVEYFETLVERRRRAAASTL
jgi:thiol-disulfide isomerase/thioredoxin